MKSEAGSRGVSEKRTFMLWGVIKSGVWSPVTPRRQGEYRWRPALPRCLLRLLGSSHVPMKELLWEGLNLLERDQILPRKLDFNCDCSYSSFEIYLRL